MDGMRDLDSWITSGRFSSTAMFVLCAKCGEETFVVAETEFGATDWNPAECRQCKESFNGEEEWSEAEAPEEEEYDED